MEKNEALNRILMTIEQVEESHPFNGRAALLKKLKYIYDRIDLYKPTPGYYELMVKEAKTLLNELQSKMDKESKGGK